MNKLVAVIALLFVFAISANTVSAQYGQEVLGEKTEEVVVVHKPVETGLMDHPELVAIASFGLSGIFYFVSKKINISAEETI